MAVKRIKKSGKKQMLSIVIPLMNEYESLKELNAQIKKNVNKYKWPHEIIYIDDGSKDKSLDILHQLKEADPAHIKIISFRRNYGKATALAHGFEIAKGDIIITMDADLQDDPNEIPNLVKKINEGYDLVSGWKYKRYDPINKTLPSKLYNHVVSRVTGLKIHDFNCGLKAYRGEVVKDIKLYGTFHRFIPAMAHWQGYKVTEIKVHHHKRKYGHTKYGARRYLNGLIDLISLWYLYKFGDKPLKLFGVTGMTLSSIGVIDLIIVYWPRIANLFLYIWQFIFPATLGIQETIEHYKNVIVAERLPALYFGLGMLIVGVQLFSIGLIGEYLVRSQTKVQDYSVKERK